MTTKEEIVGYIENDVQGYAMTRIGHQMIYFDSTGIDRSFHGNIDASKDQFPTNGGANDSVMEILVLNVARNKPDTKATDHTFLKSELDTMITARRLYNKYFTAKHEEANDLDALWNRRPKLFY